MSLLKMVLRSVFLCISAIFLTSYCSIPQNQNTNTHWVLSELIQTQELDVTKNGNPKAINSSAGSFLQFDGTDDALFLYSMPLKGLQSFTIEVIFFPESGGNFGQRFFHTGEVNGDRVLLEIRANKNDWYFDSYIKTGNQRMALADSSLLHPVIH